MDTGQQWSISFICHNQTTIWLAVDHLQDFLWYNCYLIEFVLINFRFVWFFPSFFDYFFVLSISLYWSTSNKQLEPSYLRYMHSFSLTSTLSITLIIIFWLTIQEQTLYCKSGSMAELARGTIYICQWDTLANGKRKCISAIYKVF
jgi:hypothetical protein